MNFLEEFDEFVLLNILKNLDVSCLIKIRTVSKLCQEISEFVLGYKIKHDLIFKELWVSYRSLSVPTFRIDSLFEPHLKLSQIDQCLSYLVGAQKDWYTIWFKYVQRQGSFKYITQDDLQISQLFYDESIICCDLLPEFVNFKNYSKILKPIQPSPFVDERNQIGMFFLKKSEKYLFFSNPNQSKHK
jgi:hypothetical protein